MSNGNVRQRREGLAMLEQVRSTIEKYHMIQQGDRVLAGVSGGPDSVAMLHVLKGLAGEMNFELFVAHLDHGFRGSESAEDAEYVRNLAESMGLRVLVEYRDVARYALEKKMSAQTAAREVRYCFFEEAAKKLNCNKLATGHNANDQSETVLFNFLRGSGPAGLGGIPPVRDGWIIRPLIEVTRADIEDYCKRHHLETRLDKSNLKEVYTRNKIRLNLLPQLEKEYNHNLVETLVRMSEIFREEDAFIEGLAIQELQRILLDESPKKIELNLEGFINIPPLLQKRILGIIWKRMASLPQSLEFVHLDMALKGLHRNITGTILQLPGGVCLQRQYNKLVLTIDETEDDSEYSYHLKVPGITLVEETGQQITAEFVEKVDSDKRYRDEIYIDYDAVVHPLIVRNRKSGDWFQPIGMTGSQKLKKYLIDHKIPREQRDRIPIIVSGDGQIIWVSGHRGDRRWQPAAGTKNILKIKISRIGC